MAARDPTDAHDWYYMADLALDTKADWSWLSEPQKEFLFAFPSNRPLGERSDCLDDAQEMRFEAAMRQFYDKRNLIINNPDNQVNLFGIYVARFVKEMNDTMITKGAARGIKLGQAGEAVGKSAAIVVASPFIALYLLTALAEKTYLFVVDANKRADEKARVREKEKKEKEAEKRKQIDKSFGK